MLEYIAVLLIGFWLGVAIFLYVSCYWLEEILDLPSRRATSPNSANAAVSSDASSAHAQLKKLVARVIEEAAALPALARYAADPPRPNSIESSTYEDLLATAILNRVIERYQTESGSGGRSSGIHSASASPTPSERSAELAHCRDRTPPPRSLEHDDPSDWEDEGGAGRGARTLLRRPPLPDFGEDVLHGTDGASDSDTASDAGGGWEDNWLFQRRKIKCLHAGAVPMLVPAGGARAMIGDRDAGDTTDLSDCEPDDGGGGGGGLRGAVRSRRVIGGQPSVDLDFEPDSLDHIEIVEAADAVNGAVVRALQLRADGGPAPRAEFAVGEIHRTAAGDAAGDEAGGEAGGAESGGEVDEIAADVDDEGASEPPVDYEKNRELRQSTLRGHEREGEYEETVSVPVQRYADSLRRKHFDNEPYGLSMNGTEAQDDLVPGSIAERERKKWLNYVEMPNNPYSPEAIKKRLSAKSTSSLFDIITQSKDHCDEDKTEDKSKGIKTEDDEKPDDDKQTMKKAKSELAINCNLNGDCRSPSPKILKDVLADEIPQYKRYGRDYYIKEARASSGGRRAGSGGGSGGGSGASSPGPLSSPTGLLIKQFNNIATNRQYTRFTDNHPHETITIISRDDNTQNIIIEYDAAREDGDLVFAAAPAAVDDTLDYKLDDKLDNTLDDKLDDKLDEKLDDTLDDKLDDKLEEILHSGPPSPRRDLSLASSSSHDDSIKIYNVRTGEIVKCKPVDNLSRYATSDDSADNTDTVSPGGAESRAESVERAPSAPPPAGPLCDIDELDAIKLPKVKELAKKFLSMESLDEPEPVQPAVTPKRRKSKDNILSDKTGRHQYMHSLTARSISREFREGLKLSLGTALTSPGGVAGPPPPAPRADTPPPSPAPPPGNIKLKLAFFESLKAKFSE